MNEIDNNRIIAEFMRGKPSPPNWTWGLPQKLGFSYASFM